MAKMSMGRGKVATRLPSTGLKMAKMATLMENGDTYDICDTIDTGRVRPRPCGDGGSRVLSKRELRWCDE